MGPDEVIPPWKCRRISPAGFVYSNERLQRFFWGSRHQLSSFVSRKLLFMFFLSNVQFVPNFYLSPWEKGRETVIIYGVMALWKLFVLKQHRNSYLCSFLMPFISCGRLHHLWHWIVHRGPAKWAAGDILRGCRGALLIVATNASQSMQENVNGYLFLGRVKFTIENFIT